MGKIFKIKEAKTIIICLFLFSFISIIGIYSSQSLLSSFMNNLYLKQIMWYILGSIFIIIILKFKNDALLSLTNFLYLGCNFLLLLLLFFGKEINDAKCWFQIPGIGSFQPSEFMKIILILVLALCIDKYNKKYKNPAIKQEFLFILKISVLVLIPSILTFLEPDTGVVLIYILITIIMLFIAGIRYRWFLLLILIVLVTTTFIIVIYNVNQDLFIDLFGTSFFLRVDRIFNWSNMSGFQLEQGISAIGSGGLFGNGFNKTPIYFPEPQTDFIFATFSSNFGFLGSTLLLFLIGIFDLTLIKIAKFSNHINKYLISGIIGMLFYQQIQNIGMTFGLLPITGITLPFISYGGSSLISYMLIIGIVLNICVEKKPTI